MIHDFCPQNLIFLAWYDFNMLAYLFRVDILTLKGTYLKKENCNRINRGSLCLHMYLRVSENNQFWCTSIHLNFKGEIQCLDDNICCCRCCCCRRCCLYVEGLLEMPNTCDNTVNKSCLQSTFVYKHVCEF